MYENGFGFMKDRFLCYDVYLVIKNFNFMFFLLRILFLVLMFLKNLFLNRNI